MRLRKVIKATSDFGYDALEYTLDSNKKVIERVIRLGVTAPYSASTDKATSMRSMDSSKHHEAKINGVWFHITLDEFNFRIGKHTRRVIRRRAGAETSVPTTKIQPHMLLIRTDHFDVRACERFGLVSSDLASFVSDVVDDHFIAQQVAQYKKFGIKDSKVLYLCSNQHNAIFVVKFENGKYILLTCYRLRESNWYLRWFQDHMHNLNNMMTFADYLNK